LSIKDEWLYLVVYNNLAELIILLRIDIMEDNFSFLIPEGFYQRSDDKIEITISSEKEKYSLSIYKNGTFDYEYQDFASLRTIAEKGLKNPFVNKYDYAVIKDFIETEKTISLKTEFLYDVVFKFFKMIIK